MGFSGDLDESQAAYDEFLEKQKAILREAGLGADGKGDWHNLARTGGLSRIDPNYLQGYGFSHIGGGGFARTRGLREHLVRFVAKMKSDYNGAYQSLPESHKQIIQGLVKSLKSSKDQGREWDLQQKLDDPTSFLELYRRALAASSGLWEVVIDTARHAGLPVAEDRSASPSVSWNVKLFSGRIQAKAAKYGDLGQITDVLRGSIVFDTAEQLAAGIAHLDPHHNPLVPWVDNRLGDESAEWMNGYRDVVLILNIDGHLCELQLHLKAMYDAKAEGHRAFALARLIRGDVATAEDCLLYTSPSPRDLSTSRMPSSA